MKKIKERAATILKYIYGIGIFTALFVGAISILGYVAAFCIGGETATTICVFIYKEVYPIIIYVSSVSVLLGLVKMYLSGEKGLTADSGSAKHRCRK